VVVKLASSQFKKGSCGLKFAGMVAADKIQGNYTWAGCGSEFKKGSGGSISVATSTGVFGSPPPSTPPATPKPPPTHTATPVPTASPSPSAGVDAYGGATSVHCASGAAAHFYTEKIGDRWWVCDPAGNGFFIRGVWYIVPNVNSSTASFIQ